MILLRKVQGCKRRREFTVGLQRSPYTDIEHIGSCDIVGGFREIPRDGNHITLCIRICHLKASHLLVYELAGGEICREGRNSLAVGGRCHMLYLMAGLQRKQRRKNQYNVSVFHDF